MLNLFDNFIFDLDGTIINSSQEILLCLQRAFAESNYNIDKSKFTSDIIGPPIKEIIKIVSPKLSDEAIISDIIKNFRRIYDYNEEDVSIMYEGIYDVLLSLRDNDKRLFVATFKPSVPTQKLLKKFKLNMFDDVYTVDKFDKPMSKAEMISDIIEKYNLNREKTVMIGDTVSDMQAAKLNSIKSAAVSWGYEKNMVELKETSDFFIDKAKDLL